MRGLENSLKLISKNISTSSNIHLEMIKVWYFQDLTPTSFTLRASLDTDRAMSRRSGHDLWTNQSPVCCGGRPMRGQRSAATAAGPVEHFQCPAIAHVLVTALEEGRWRRGAQAIYLEMKGFCCKRLRGLPFLLGTGCATHKICSQLSRS